MEVKYTNRGFEYLDCNIRLQQSSAIGDYEDSFDKPGSSFLWVEDEQLSREEVKHYLDEGFFSADVVPHIEAWLSTGSFKIACF